MWYVIIDASVNRTSLAIFKHDLCSENYSKIIIDEIFDILGYARVVYVLIAYHDATECKYNLNGKTTGWLVRN